MIKKDLTTAIEKGLATTSFDSANVNGVKDAPADQPKPANHHHQQRQTNSKSPIDVQVQTCKRCQQTPKREEYSQSLPLLFFIIHFEFL